MPRFQDHDDQDDGVDDAIHTQPCPHCQADVYEDAEQCPSCGNYLSREDSVERKPVWVVIGALAALGIVIYWMISH